MLSVALEAVRRFLEYLRVHRMAYGFPHLVSQFHCFDHQRSILRNPSCSLPADRFIRGLWNVEAMDHYSLHHSDMGGQLRLAWSPVSRKVSLHHRKLSRNMMSGSC